MALLGPSHPHDEGRECGTCAAYNLLADLPAATPSDHGLDVERLARALVLWAGKYPEFLDDEGRTAARRIATEYAALAERLVQK